MAGLDKLLIISTTMKRWAPVTHRLVKEEILREKAVDSEELLRSLNYSVNAPGASDQGSVEFSFLMYGRFRDMGVGRGAGTNIESQAGNKAIARGARKPAKWWSKIIYNRIYGSLIAQLVGGYSETIRRNQKGILVAKLS